MTENLRGGTGPGTGGPGSHGSEGAEGGGLEPRHG